MSDKDIKLVLSGPPNILVTTPACVATCISKGIVHGSSLKDSLSTMILGSIALVTRVRSVREISARKKNAARLLNEFIACSPRRRRADGYALWVQLRKRVRHQLVSLRWSTLGTLSQHVIYYCSEFLVYVIKKVNLR